MTIIVEPELNVPVKTSEPSADLKTRVAAAANTAKELGEHGVDLTPNTEDKDAAARLAPREEHVAPVTEEDVW